MNQNRKQLFEILSRLPARVWIQAILALIGFVVLAVLGFAVIAGIAGVALLALLAFKAKTWFLGLFGRGPAAGPPAHHDGHHGPNEGKVIDVQYEIVDRRGEKTPRE